MHEHGEGTRSLGIRGDVLSHLQFNPQHRDRTQAVINLDELSYAELVIYHRSLHHAADAEEL